MTTLPSGLPVVVDRAGGAPLAVQISAQLQAAVTGGVLRAGDRLPSSRDLAATLCVSRTVVTNAYARLFAEGWLEGRHGSGTYVANVTPPPPPPTLRKTDPKAPARPMEALNGVGAPTSLGSNAPTAPIPALQSANEPERRPWKRDQGTRPLGGPTTGSIAQLASIEAAESANEPQERVATSPTAGRRGLIDLQPGIPWAEGIEPAIWRRAWRQAGAHLPSRWPDPYGLPELREEVAAYLRRSRGLAVTPAHILITQGVSSGLALLADALLAPGDKAGVEEPGYPTGREVLRRAGARVMPCRVDAHGILPEELPGDLKLLYTTPAHQYPLGGRLPVSRRQALIAWARDTGALVVEDDYDSEFRYDVGPLPALHSMDPDVIVYLGTASKVLATAFGAGWLVAPPEIIEKLAALRSRLGVRIPEPVQHAILALLRSGDLERHVRKMRLEYARRRAALVDALTHPDTATADTATADAATPDSADAATPDAATPDSADAATADAAGNPVRVPFRLFGDTAGIHVVLELPDDYRAARLIDAAAERGVAVYSLDRYFAGTPTMNGLILGYGTATLPQVRRAAAELAQLLDREAWEVRARAHSIPSPGPRQ